MATSGEGFETTPAGAGQFASTHWSVVLAAGRESSQGAREALTRLCQAYWYPLYAYIRRQGRGPHDAEDLTQEFFARFLEKKFLADVHRERGRFRSFLLAALKHFLANEGDRARAHKRGGRCKFISLDERAAERRYALEPREDLSADKIYERRWALTLLDQVLSRLKGEFADAGKAEQFERLKIFLSVGRSAAPYSAVAAQLRTTEEAVKVAVHRLRKRYRELLREEIAQTVAGRDEIEEEIRHIIAVLSA